MSRRNFTRNQREQIAERAKNERGEICCEGCGLVLGSKMDDRDWETPLMPKPNMQV